MDYEKKYNEALQLARSYYSEDSNQFLDTIFPELTESEDERIRQWLLNTIHQIPNDSIEWEVIEKKTVIAYLEKQKDSIPYEKYVEDIDDICTAYETGAIEQKPSISCGHENDKPADDKSFEGWIDDWWRHHKINNPDSYNKGDEIQFDERGFKNFCRGIRNMYAEQKSAEWSEEDKAFLKVAMAICNRYSHKDIAHWLKSLPERLNLQPKQEWSEEDDIRQSIIKDIKWERDNTPVTVCKDIRKYDKQINFLKSLRPKPQGTYQQVVKGLRDMCDRYEQNGMFTDERARDFLGNVRVKCKDAIECAPILDEPHWKPSEEHMQALKYAIEDVAKFSKRGGRKVELKNEPYYSALHSLYCNLEKLMEE